MRTYVGNSKNSIKRHYICKDGKWDDANYPKIQSTTGNNIVQNNGYFELKRNYGVNMAFSKAKFKGFKRVRFVFRTDIEIGRSNTRLKVLGKYPIINTYNELIGTQNGPIRKENVYFTFELDFETYDFTLNNVQFFFLECLNNTYAHESVFKLYDVWFEDASYDK